MSLIYHTSGEPGGLDERQSGPGPWDQLASVTIPPSEGSADTPPSYSRDNPNALPVNQRSSAHWSGTLYLIKGTALQVSHVLPAQKGRKSFTLIVPSSAGAGVYVDHTPDTLNTTNPIGFPVAVGAGISVETEDDVYAVSATPGTDTQVAVIVTWG